MVKTKGITACAAVAAVAGAAVKTELIDNFKSNPVHKAISICCELRPPVDISCAAPSTVKEVALP